MKLSRKGLFGWVIVIGFAPAAAVAAPITFTDIARNANSGIDYRRAPSATNAIADAVKLLPFMAIQELASYPHRPRGVPGVALFDYDRDGDLDMFVTNGPGRGNSLYQNRLKETGILKFVDKGSAAKVDAADMDATGVCYGDIDNDGDLDLLVLGRMEPARLFRNQGNGKFKDISATANVGTTALGRASCAMGDVNGDGLLDIFIGNSFDWSRFDAIYTNWFSFNHANELYINQGNNTFTEASESAGLKNLVNTPPGDATITWAVSLVDYDLDGDLDIIQADDQGALPPAAFAGIDRGLLQVFNNDGNGNFTNVTVDAGLARASSWMGLAFADLNCDGHMDLFATSIGDYLIPQMGIPTPPGLDSSRWHLGLGTPAGSFQEPGVGSLVATPFGWGTGAADYDNDGDTDIIFYGALEVGPFITADNPGVVLENHGCSATFTWDQNATASSADHTLRNTADGMALGDLNNDGFVDIVYAGGQYVPETIPLIPTTQKWGSVFDQTSYVLPTFFPVGPLEWEWAGKSTEDGYMGVKVNSASNGNKWVKISTLGTKGITPLGKSNRDGIGATVMFTPQNGKRVMLPILGGSSFASQHDLTVTFGLGNKNKGTVDILWPGGTRNRLYNVSASEQIRFPEIPCSLSGTWPNIHVYTTCVDNSLNALLSGGHINAALRNRLRQSAIKAYNKP